MSLRCYGKEYNRRNDCGGCSYREWCKDAADLPLIGRMKEFRNTVDVSTEDVALIAAEPEKPVYTVSDMAAVLRWALTVRKMSGGDLQIVLTKLQMPGISLAEIGKRRGMSRMGVLHRVEAILKEFPELTGVLRNHPRRKGSRKVEG